MLTNPHFSNDDLYLDYWKKETILDNPIAEKQFILPDIKPLPSMITDIQQKKKIQQNSSSSQLQKSNRQVTVCTRGFVPVVCNSRTNSAFWT